MRRRGEFDGAAPKAARGVRRGPPGVGPSSAAQLGERRAEGGRGLREEVALEVRHRGPVQGECAVRPDHVRDAESDAVDAVELGEHGGMGLPEMLPISGKDCSKETRTGTWNPNTAHSLDVDAVVEALHAPQTGLTSAQVYQRREELGSNSLPHGESKPAWRRFLGHFEDVLIYILLTAAVLKALTGDQVNFAVIAAAALAVATVGFIQEGRAEQALESIRSMLSLEAQARRDGEWAVVDAECSSPEISSVSAPGIACRRI